MKLHIKNLLAILLIYFSSLVLAGCGTISSNMKPQENKSEHYHLTLPVSCVSSDTINAERLAYLGKLADEAAAIANKATAVGDKIDPNEAPFNSDRSKYDQLSALSHKAYLLVETATAEADKAKAIALEYAQADAATRDALEKARVACLNITTLTTIANESTRATATVRAHAVSCSDIVARIDAAFRVASRISINKSAAATHAVCKESAIRTAIGKRKQAELNALSARIHKASAKMKKQVMKTNAKLEKQRIKKEKEEKEKVKLTKRKLN